MTALDRLWIFQSANLALLPDEIHVWHSFPDPPPSRFQYLVQALSPGEQRMVEGLHFERNRKRFIVGRGLLRVILGCYLSAEPSRLQFCYGSGRKPVLSEALGTGGLRFNLSHSQGLALYAVTRDREIDIDLERVRPVPQAEQIAERFFTPRENAVFCALPPSKKREVFLNCWTRKEAYIKAIGDGLARSLDRIDVSMAP